MVPEPSIVAILIVTIAFFATVLGGGWLIYRTMKNPDRAIGARTRKRFEEMEDQKRLEAERRRLEEERRLDGESDHGEEKDETDD